MNMDVINQNKLAEYEKRLSALMDEKKQQELVAEAIKNNVKAKTKLIENNLRVVLNIVKEYVGKIIDINDLISVGALGLVKAVNSYSEDTQSKFSEYVSNMIRVEIEKVLDKVSC